MVDIAQKSHVKLLLKAKWKIEQARLVLADNSPVSALPRKLDYSTPTASATSPPRKTKPNDSPSRFPNQQSRDSEDISDELDLDDDLLDTPVSPNRDTRSAFITTSPRCAYLHGVIIGN